MAPENAHPTPVPPRPSEVCAYVEDIAMDLAAMASRAGETALASSLALVGLQAGDARRRYAAARA
ncbi:MAG: hypothetical protein INR64_15875 [Caulobacteraceae bacterium]|nr:hypothetical protein [Caulobacter sp.]